MKMRNASLITLMLLFVGMLFCSCEKNNNEENNLGASRPNPQLMPFTRQMGVVYSRWGNQYYTATFDKVYFILSSKSDSKAVARYNYTYNYPNITLIPEGETEVTLKIEIVEYIIYEEIVIRNLNNTIISTLRRLN